MAGRLRSLRMRVDLLRVRPPSTTSGSSSASMGGGCGCSGDLCHTHMTVKCKSKWRFYTINAYVRSNVLGVINEDFSDLDLSIKVPKMPDKYYEKLLRHNKKSD